MATPKVKLTDLHLKRFAMVGAGDNPGAHMLMSKAKGEGKKPVAPGTDEEGNDTVPTEPKKKSLAERFKAWIMPEPVEKSPRTTAQILRQEQFMSDFYKLKNAFTESVWSILDGDIASDEGFTMLQRSVAEFGEGLDSISPAMKSRAPGSHDQVLDIFATMKQTIGTEAWKTAKNREDFTAALASLEAFTLKDVQDATDQPEEDDMSQKDQSTKSFDELLATVADEETRNALKAAHEAELTTTDDTAKDEPDEDEALKSLPEAARKAVEKANATAAEAMKKAAKLEEAAKNRDYLAKAKAKGIDGVDTDVLAKAMRFADESADGAAEFMQLIDALGAQASKGRNALTTVKGTTRTGDEVTDAEKKVDAAVAEAMKADASLTKQQAYAQVLKSNPSLYAALDESDDD